MRGQPKPRNNSTWSEARYWSQVRSHLRNAFRYWQPITEAKLLARIPYKGTNKLRKWSYKCAHCLQLFKSVECAIDHIEPVGSLKCAEDIAPFLAKLTREEPEAYQCLCKSCHQIKTNADREAAKEK